MRATKNVKTTVTLPPALKAKIEARMEKTGLSMSELVRRWIERGIEEDERREQPRLMIR